MAKKQKRTGPSKRTAAQRAEINASAKAFKRRSAKAATEKQPPAKKPAPPKTVLVTGRQQTRFPREIKLDKIVTRQDMGDVSALARSIDERGALLQPIVIDTEDFLIAGQRRLAAWALSKFRKEPIPVHVVAIDSILAGERDENACRKDFTPSENVALYERLIVEAAWRAKQRQSVGGQRKPIAEHEKGAAAEEVAKYLGRDRRTIERAKVVVDAARAEPEKFAPLVEAMDKTGKVNGPFKRLQILRQVEDIKEKKANGKLDLPAGKYDRIVADMPWPHEPEDPDPAGRGRATRDYPTMSIAEMKAMPIGKRAGKDCVLYMWVTNFHMRYAYEVLDAWGFKHAPTIISWAKDKFGKGQRLREATEHCVVAIKGKPVWNLTNQTTLLAAPVREDSRKPDEFYALIDALTPAQRSLELFARRELPAGWEGFGDQVGKFKDEPPEHETFGNISEGLLKACRSIGPDEGAQRPHARRRDATAPYRQR